MIWRVLIAVALLAAPGVAAADPITVFAALEPIIGATWAAAAATVVSYGSYIVTAAAITYGQLEQRRKMRAAAAAARRSFNASLSDRSVTLLQADPPQRCILGRALVGGYIVAMFTTDKQGTRIDGSTYTRPDGLRHMVVVFAAHRCRALHEVKIDGAPVNLALLDGNGWTTTGEFASAQSIRREVVLASGASWTAPAAMTVSSCVEQVSGGDDQRTGTYTLSAGNTVVTNTSAFACAISLTYSVTQGSVRVSYHLGADDQAADTYLTGLLGGSWTAAHTLSGLAYAVITLDLENERFQAAPPGMQFDVSGAIAYDPRRNTFHNPLLAGAAAGTLATGTSWGNARGLAQSVTGGGVDDATGLLYMEVRLQGTASSTGSVVLALTTAATARAASAGQAWACRVGMAVRSVTTVPGYLRASLASYDAGGSVTTEADGNNISFTVGARQQWSAAQDAALASGAVGVGIRVFMGVTSGQTYDTVVRVMLPQLWPGSLDDDATDVEHWTDNNALLTAWFLRARSGMAVAFDDVNDPALVVSANACDATIPLVLDATTTSGPTYTANGSFTTDEAPETVLESLAKSMAGLVSYGADWRIIAGAWTLPVATLTDDDLDGQIQILQAGAGVDAMFNSVRSQYLPLGEVTPADSLYSNDVFVSADGQQLWTDEQLDWTNHPSRALNLQRIMVERGRSSLVISMPCKLTAWPLQVGDRIALDNAEYGWSGKLWQVTDWRFGLQAPVTLLLQEDAADIYDQADAATSDPTPNTGLPNPWLVATPNVTAVNSGTQHLLVQKDGTIITRVRVSWSASTDPYVLSGGTIELSWRIAGRDAPNVWRVLTPPGDSVGEYLVGANDGDVVNWQVCAINSLGRRSALVHGSHTVVGKTAPPEDVSNIDADIIYGAVRVTVPKSTEADVVGVILRRGASWAAGVPLVGTEPTIMRGSEYLWAWPPYGTYTVWAKYVDSTGHESAVALGTSVLVNDAIKLGSNGIDVDLAGINLASNSSFEIDRNADGLADNWNSYSQGTTGSVGYASGAGRLKGASQAVSGSGLGGAGSDRIGVRRNIAVGTAAIQNLCASVYVAGSSGRTAVLVAYFVSGGSVVGNMTATVALTGTTVWKRLVATQTAFDPTVDRVDVYVYLTGSGSSVLLVDDFLLEEATLPSAWHPSPLDELIKTDDIKDNAATDLAHYTDTTPASHPSEMADTAFTAEVDCTAVVNISCEVEIDASAQTTTKHKWWICDARVSATGATPSPTQVTSAGAGDRSDIEPGNIERVTAVAQAVYQLQAGGTYRAFGFFANKVPQSTINAVPLSAVLRIEVIKR